MSAHVPNELDRSSIKSWLSVQQRRYGMDDLRRHERFFDENAIGHALCAPFMAAVASHVDDRQARIHLPRGSGHISTRNVSTKVDVCDESAARVAKLREKSRSFCR